MARQLTIELSDKVYSKLEALQAIMLARDETAEIIETLAADIIDDAVDVWIEARTKGE